MFCWTQPIFIVVASVIMGVCGTVAAEDLLDQTVPEIPSFPHARLAFVEDLLNKGPVCTGPSCSAAVNVEPVYSGPIYTEPANSVPAYAETANSAPVYSEPVYSVPIPAHPTHTDTICTEPLLTSDNANLQNDLLDIGQVNNLNNLDGSVFTTFFGVEGSKQPQDLGVNANFGGRVAFNYAAPLLKNIGVGFQIGSSFVGTGNAVQVFELFGESTGRFQQYTTIGVFRRTEGPLSFGAVYDHLFQNSFDKFNLGQVRLRMGYFVNPNTEIGTTANLSSRSESGLFNDTEVRLTPIEMLTFFVNHQWQSQARTRMWIGVADGHGEDSAAFGSGVRKNNQLAFGAEIFAPMNNFMAIYGETNLVMPADTGAVDAYLGVQIIPGGIGRFGRANRFRPMFAPGSNATFVNDIKFE